MHSCPKARKIETERKTLTGLLINPVCDRANTKVQCPSGLDVLTVRMGCRGLIKRERNRRMDGVSWWRLPGEMLLRPVWLPHRAPKWTRISAPEQDTEQPWAVKRCFLSSTSVLSNPIPINAGFQPFFNSLFLPEPSLLLSPDPYGLPLQYKLGCHRSFCDVENLPFQETAW